MGKRAPEPGRRVPENCCSHGLKAVLNFKSLLKNNKTQSTTQPPKILSPCPASLSNSSELLFQAWCKPPLGNQPVKDRVWEKKKEKANTVTSNPDPLINPSRIPALSEPAGPGRLRGAGAGPSPWLRGSGPENKLPCNGGTRRKGTGSLAFPISPPPLPVSAMAAESLRGILFVGTATAY